MPQNITFRTTLLGSVAEFSQNTGLPVFAQPMNLVELIVLLAHYQEEGNRLSPKVYVTSDISILCSMLPDSERIAIGACSADANGIRQAVKKCAPLANGGWMIYLDNHTDTTEFGVFRGPSNPISVLVDEAVLSENAKLAVVKVFQVSTDCVEIVSNKGARHYVYLDHRPEETPPPLQYLDELVSHITEQVQVEYCEPTRGLLTRLLFDALRECHGSIIAVTGMSSAPKILSGDGVILDQPIDFGDLVGKLSRNEIDRSLVDSKGDLLKGMLNCDGILLFDDHGRLLVYNCFVKVNQKKAVIGGARKRAFAALGDHIGHGLCAVFMQSQDGASDFRDTK